MAELPALRRTRYSALRFGLSGCVFPAAICRWCGHACLPGGPRVTMPAGRTRDDACPGSKAERASPRGPRPRPGIPAAADLEGSDPAVGPGPVGVRPWITAVRPPVGDQDPP